MFWKNNQKVHNVKKTISMKMFNTEFGSSFHSDIKNRLLDLNIRTVLTREEDTHILDIKHVEHIKEGNKEPVYGQLIVLDNQLYFSEKCRKKDNLIPSKVIADIYNNLTTESATINDMNVKKIDETNIDFIVDSILGQCGDVSKEYMNIMEKYLK